MCGRPAESQRAHKISQRERLPGMVSKKVDDGDDALRTWRTLRHQGTVPYFELMFLLPCLLRVNPTCPASLRLCQSKHYALHLQLDDLVFAVTQPCQYAVAMRTKSR